MSDLTFRLLVFFGFFQFFGGFILGCIAALMLDTEPWVIKEKWGGLNLFGKVLTVVLILLLQPSFLIAFIMYFVIWVFLIENVVDFIWNKMQK